MAERMTSKSVIVKRLIFMTTSDESFNSKDRKQVNLQDSILNLYACVKMCWAVVCWVAGKLFENQSTHLTYR